MIQGFIDLFWLKGLIHLIWMTRNLKHRSSWLESIVKVYDCELLNRRLRINQLTDGLKCRSKSDILLSFFTIIETGNMSGFDLYVNVAVCCDHYYKF